MFAALIGLVFLDTAPVRAQKLEPLSVRLYFVTTGFHVPIFYAKENGLFKAAGLDVDIHLGLHLRRNSLGLRRVPCLPECLAGAPGPRYTGPVALVW